MGGAAAGAGIGPGASDDDVYCRVTGCDAVDAAAGGGLCGLGAGRTGAVE
jgi:hypothetical protein